MKGFSAIALAFCLSLSASAEDPAAKIQEELQAILKEAGRKVSHSEFGSKPDLSSELQSIEKLYQKHKEQQNDAVSEILVAKGRIYIDVLDDLRNGADTFKRIAKDNPNVSFLSGLTNAIASIELKLSFVKAADKLQPGTAFPGFKVPDLGGKTVSLADFKGKVVLVDFWGTFCPPCIREMPDLRDLREKHAKAGFEIIGISVDESRSELEGFIKRTDMPWVILPDLEADLQKRYGILQFPTKYLIGRNGKIAKRWIGPDSDDLAAAVADLMAKN